MEPERKSGIIVGTFYIAATLSGILSLTFLGTVLQGQDLLTNISENELSLKIGTIFELIMGISVASIAIAIYPVLKRFRSSIAIGYFGARLVEAMLFLINVICLLSLLTLSREFTEASVFGEPRFRTIAELLVNIREWGVHIPLDIAVFPVGALLLYFTMYHTKLVPRWISAWGILGAILYLMAGLFVLFEIIQPLSTNQVLLDVPLALQEMVLAVWLIIRGFNSENLLNKHDL